MPFTFSHPAAVLVFRKLEVKGFSMTAAIAGSIAPDFEYFIRMMFVSKISHKFPGILWFDIPMALALTFIFHLAIKDELIDHLPRGISGRLQPIKRLNWPLYFRQHAAGVFASLLLGLMSHLIWDSFTHSEGTLVKMLAFLNFKYQVSGIDFRIFHVLKYLTAALGLYYILYVFLKLPAEKTMGRKTASQFIYWGSIFFITFLVLLIRFMTGLVWVQENSIIISAISGFLIGLFIMGIAGKVRKYNPAG